MLSYIYDFFMGVAFLASLTIYFTGNTYKYLRLFPLFLLVVCIVAGTGSFLSSRGKSNVVLYNLLLLFEFCFYFYTLYLIIHHRNVKRVIAYVPPVFAGLAILNMIFLQKITVFNSMTYALGSLLTVAICIYYFFELFQFSHPVNVARQPAFWICAGLLFFYACTFPVFGMINFLKSAPYVIKQNLRTILNLLNVFLYSSFTIAFLCRIRARNSTS